MERILRNEPVSNAVAKRNKHHNNTRRQNIADITPIDLRNLANHHAPDQDESTSRSPRRDRSKYRSKEDGDDKAQSRNHSREAGASTLRDTRTAFDEGRDGGASKQRPDGYERRVGAVSNG